MGLKNMKQINFSKNWNGKLSCESFSTIRIYNPDKYIIGESYALNLESQHIGSVEIVALRTFTLSELTDEMAYLDTGKSLKDMIIILKEIYPSLKEDTMLHYIICKYAPCDLYDRAYYAAAKAHKGQIDKAGKPYIGHLERVSAMSETPYLKSIALLHDILEDTDYNSNDLLMADFPECMVRTIECLTKMSEDEPYDEFIERVAQDPIAVAVKLNDLRDNMDVTRLKEFTDKDVRRTRKYLKAYNYLLENYESNR